MANENKQMNLNAARPSKKTLGKKRLKFYQSNNNTNNPENDLQTYYNMLL